MAAVGGAGAGEDASKKELATDLSNPAVTDKYREAAKIAQMALEAVITKLTVGAKVVDVCEFGDSVIVKATEKSFKSAKIEKGIAFPTCLSVNECVGHYSPLKSESELTLKAGDAVKIDLGVHFDGYIATVAHTHVVAEDAVTGVRADVIAAAYTAAEAAVRLIKPGNSNTQVTEAIAKVCTAFGVNPMAGVLMHRMEHYKIDGDKVILLRGDDPEIKVDDAVFEAGEVYAIDIITSSGEGKPRETDARTTVYRVAHETPYKPKMKAAQAVLREAASRFTLVPFTLRALENESQARMGVVELARHGNFHAYPVLHEREGAEVAHVKFTVLLLPGGTLKVTGLSLPANVKSDKVAALPEDITALLATVPYAKKEKVAKA